MRLKLNLQPMLAFVARSCSLVPSDEQVETKNLP